MSESYFKFWGKDFQLFQKSLEIRKKVFIEEQKIDPKIELDGRDFQAIHFLILFNNQPISTCRTRYLTRKKWKLERMATLKKYRGQGYGKNLLDFVHNEGKKMDIEEIHLNAQKRSLEFYKKCGYDFYDDNVFYEAEIPHFKMFKIIKGE